ncbi:MAG TPA: VWA domain-containing protein [Phycisphaerales bacterium]|nr:VWA domain-containing protein [Phycisphaerales bacterium]
MRLGNEEALWLLFAAGFVIVPVYVWCFWRKRCGLANLAESALLEQISVSVSFTRQVIKGVILVVAFVAIVIALTEPGWNPRPKMVKSKGRDVVILLDVSKSMLAEDIRPNRLERAKIAIADLLDVIDGDRIGLVTFAGDSSVKCPLTQDYAFIRMTLGQIGPESTTMGGTLIGDAIRDASEKVFDADTDKYKDIILITDGEDHESFPVEAAQIAAGQGVRIIAIGLGDEETGTPIPVIGADGKKTFIEYEGKQVLSKLDGETLRQVALASPEGKYLAVRTGTFDLDDIYEDMVASAAKREFEAMSVMEYDERFQVFLVLAIVLIFCEALISERKKL